MFCKNCGSEVNGPFCAKCGTPVDSIPAIQSPNVLPKKKKKRALKIVLIVIGVILGLNILIAIIGSATSSGSKQSTASITTKESVRPTTVLTTHETAKVEPTTKATTVETLSIKDRKELAKHYSYKTIARSPDDYIGKDIKFSGTVVQVMEGVISEYRIAENDDYDSIWYVQYARPEGSPRILEDDTVTVYGTCTGLISYESTMGGTISIPGAMSSIIEISDTTK